VTQRKPVVVKPVSLDWSDRATVCFVFFCNRDKLIFVLFFRLSYLLIIMMTMLLISIDASIYCILGITFAWHSIGKQSISYESTFNCFNFCAKQTVVGGRQRASDAGDGSAYAAHSETGTYIAQTEISIAQS
jgi:hypothetical protein